MPEETVMTVDEDSDIVPIRGDAKLLTELFGGAVNNFDGDSTQRMKLELLASSSKCGKDDKKDGTVFDIMYFHLHRASKIDPRTGELIEWVRTVLFNPKMETIDFGSDVVAKSVAIIARNMGGNKYDPPVSVKVRHRPRDGKNDMIDLVPIF